MNGEWKTTSDQLSLSEQFLMSNDFGYDQYSFGGSADLAIQWLSIKGQTVEITKNYPYHPDKLETQWLLKNSLEPKLPKESYLLPFQTHSYLDSHRFDVEKVPVVLIYNHIEPVGDAAQHRMKVLLSKGLPLLVNMRLDD